VLDKFLSKRSNIIILAIVAVFMESLTSPCLKLGGRYPFLSPGYIAWFCLAVAILGFYAVCWQLILEKLPLTTAYLRRGFSYILIFVWATLIFHEAITWKQILGIMVITLGMVISISDEKSSDRPQPSDEAQKGAGNEQ
jgi:drug/metabolite transporter (DMT)-like permease